MNIQFYEKEKVFKIDTPNTSYLLGIVGSEKFVGHIYYGEKIDDHDLADLMRIQEAPFTPDTNNRDRGTFYDSFPFELPGCGVGDFRESAITVRDETGNMTCMPLYKGHRIYKGKAPLKGLPATFGKEDECTSLELHLWDEELKLSFYITYSAFHELDIITRSMKVVNESTKVLFLEKALSASLDMDNENYEMITLHGAWARERRQQRKSIGLGKQSVGSFRGETSHQEHPFIALVSPNTDQDKGKAYGFHFVYSGNFLAQAECNQFGSVRVLMGIHPENFKWKLIPGDEFVTPEVVMNYSGEGLGKMTRTFHDLYRNHLIRGSYKDKKRPILINNWEATYFDFNTEKLIAIAREAKAVGIEMLVMDDGWFGNRFDDNRALGDWEVNEEKLPGGLEYLISQVNQIGLKFGIWMEPEMISPESELYKSHPDWAIRCQERKNTLLRNQFVLDLTRREVLEHTYQNIVVTLKSGNIEYLKWDMNRQLTNIGSMELEPDRMGEFYHRYVLAVYELQERMIQEFPDLLLENCSGGGARFDPGMLYYSPQIWCSDDTDAIERLSIQEGTAMLYPLSAIGAHVSDCPNHTVGRNTPFRTRGHVALAGTFGYELDVTKIPREDRDMIPEQVKMYHEYNDLVREGDYYRIASYQENREYDCYQVVSKNKKETLITFVQVMNRPNQHSRKIYPKGLDENTVYALEGTGKKRKGNTWMNAGMIIENPWGDFQSCLLHLVALENE